MTKRKPLTKTQKLRKIVQQQIRRMENRGYRIAQNIKEKIKTGKYQTLLSLQRNKYAKVYEGATAEIDSNIVTGKEYRKYERKETARKAATTRQKRKRNVVWKNADEELAKKRKNIKQDSNVYDEEYESQRDREEWERERRQKDIEEMKRAEAVDEGQIIYEQVTSLIESYPTAGSLLLGKALNAEVAKYGKNAVVQALANSDYDFVSSAQEIIYYEEEANAIHKSVVRFFDVITGTIESTQQAKELGEAMDEMTDMSPI